MSPEDICEAAIRNSSYEGFRRDMLVLVSRDETQMKDDEDAYNEAMRDY